MNGEALQTLEVPPSLRILTIFQDPKKNAWAEQGAKNEKETQLLLHATDNSNTQFAMLGLWAAQRHGVPMEPTFRIMVERFERSQVANGWWAYHFDHKGDLAYVKRFPSMICVGLLGLGIGRGLKLPTPGASRAPKEDLRILKGLAALSQDLGVAAGRPEDPLTKRGSYYLWSVERVAMLYDLPMIGDKDWYKWGTGILIAAQGSRGEWNNVLVNGKNFGGGRGISTMVVADTSFALLFLKRSHPLKELTAKLPFKARELNQGIARLLNGAPPLEPSTTTPSLGDKPNR